MYMRTEKISPFQYLPLQEWRLVYVILRGTQMSIHKLKTSRFGSDSIPEAGRLIRRYTLQHAEVGLADDVDDDILIPQTRLAHLIPTIARRKAFCKDPDLFRCERQYALRLRLETEQFLLASHSQDFVFKWVNSVCAGIDIAPPLDERSLPKQCTVPRRRRQRRPQPLDNLQDTRLVQEQERILRNMYPTLGQTPERTAVATDNTNSADNLQRVDTVDQPSSGDLTLVATNLPDQQDAEDIDLSAMAEDTVEASVSRPTTARQTTNATLANSTAPSTTLNPLNFDSQGKWAPLHPHSTSQQLRYTRRCMPVLHFTAPRCSNIIMSGSRRLRVNQRMDMLEEWELAPPTYDAHNFSASPVVINNGRPLARSATVTSTRDTASITQSGSDLDIQVSRAFDTGSDGEGLGAVLEKTDTRGSISRKTGNSPVVGSAQRHDKIDAHQSHTHMQHRRSSIVGFY